MTAREELAAVLAEHDLSEPHGGTASAATCSCSCGWFVSVVGGLRSTARRGAVGHVADALLASPALAAIKAEVWEQGFMYAAEQDHPAWPRTRRFINPHDANQTDTEETP